MRNGEQIVQHPTLSVEIFPSVRVEIQIINAISLACDVMA